MESEPVEFMAPNPRYARGLRDPAFRRSHTRFVNDHDKRYIEQHKLTKTIDEAWETCLIQKPADPLRFLANALDPFSQRKLVLELQDELENLSGEFQGKVRYMSDREIEVVSDSFTAMLAEQSLCERFYHCAGEVDPNAAERLRQFDGSCRDASHRFLPLLRLLTDNLREPSLVESFIRGTARLHLNEGILERDYQPLTSGVLTLARRFLTDEAATRDDATKRAWVKLHSLLSLTMAAGGSMKELHTKHQNSLTLSRDEVAVVKRSLAKVKDRASASTAIARTVLDTSPSIATFVEHKELTPATFGTMMLDGVELIVDMLDKRGQRPALDYLRVLGQKHAGWGVRQSMYPAVGQALLAAVGHSLHKDSEVLVEGAMRAWRKAVDMLVGMLKKPLAKGDPIPSAEAMFVSELRAKQVDPHLEADLAEIVSGRATPDFTSAAPDVRQVVGDITNVPVTERQLQLLFDKYDVEGSRWISKDTMVQILMSQEEFGVPVSMNRAVRQIDDVLRKTRMADTDKISFHLFSILMLQVAQR